MSYYGDIEDSINEKRAAKQLKAITPDELLYAQECLKRLTRLFKKGDLFTGEAYREVLLVSQTLCPPIKEDEG